MQQQQLLPKRVEAAILGFLPAAAVPAAPAAPLLRRKSVREDNDEDGPLPRVETPLPASVVFALVSATGPRCAVIDGFMGSRGAELALDAAEAARACGRLKAAGVGHGAARRVDASARGDSSTFLGDTDEKDGGLGAVAVRLRLARAQLSAGEFGGHIDSTVVSTQLACYERGARYARHADSDVTQAVPRRKFTAVYYMTYGSQLRLYPEDSRWTPDGCGHLDVEPAPDRLLLFASDLEHEVLPSTGLRFALTQWWYANDLPPVDVVKIPRAPPLHPPSIFVSVAAYRDPLALATVRDALAKAKTANVVVGVVAQYDVISGADDDWFRHDYDPRVRWARVDFRDAAGPCPARALALDLLDDQDFVLQIDAHTQFTENWDLRLLEDHRRCGGILTTYPMDFASKGDERPTLLAPSRFDDDGALRIVGRVLRERQEIPLPSPLWCAGFSFAPREAVLRVKYDPHLRFLFFGEEMVMAARFWTHGYDFFAPSRAVLYHKWSRAGRPNFREDARLYGDPRAERRYRARSLRRLRALFGASSSSGDDDVGPNLDSYGLGHVRTLADFQNKVGVDFLRRVVRPGAYDAGHPPDVFVPTTLS
ncbi:hypothetical protein CTAYLR_006111 [Chrysophaeum taylorii]|uniref:procollagen-lysine 5-dioxygenase n=1 Tax=Chrysophaeum taylorii TaxID=2483200 RepID=A0AAD7U9N3_9STRA|nr:hypothetical protein CTAYLR_006111 [Chrysophaeum taylorii]